MVVLSADQLCQVIAGAAQLAEAAPARPIGATARNWVTVASLMAMPQSPGAS